MVLAAVGLVEAICPGGRSGSTCSSCRGGLGHFARVQDYRLLEGAGGSTVIRHVAKAAEAGYLVVDARERDNGSSSSNIYRPTMPGVVAQRHHLVAHRH